MNTKPILRFISLWGWGYKKNLDTDTRYLVVNFQRAAEYDGALSHYEAYKTDEFSTLADVAKYLDERVAKADLHYIRVYQQILVPSREAESQTNNPLKP